MFQDLRFGARMLLKNPGFTSIAIFTLALGIGASSAMFSFFDAVLFKPLAYQAPEQLVTVLEQTSGGQRIFPSIPIFQEWRRQNPVFSHLSALGQTEFTRSGRGAAERVRGRTVSANYFELLGVQPALGRFFNSDEEQAGKEKVVVLTNRYWKQRFGSDTRIVGAKITLDNESYTVIGVAPPQGSFDRDSSEMWLPLVFTPDKIRSQARFFSVEARLKPGVAIEKADLEMKRITKGMQALTFDNKGSAVVLPLREYLVGPDYRRMTMLLMGAALFIMLIACANVANLLLARSLARRREIAVRAALGAGRLRLVRQLFTESVLLAIISGGIGVILAFWLIRGFTALMPRRTIPSEVEVTIDWRVLLFTVGASLLTGIIFGLAPAWQASRTDLTRSLQEHDSGASARLGRNKLRSLLLVSEIALTFTLVIGAALLIRSFARVLQIDPGFQTERILTFQTNLDKKSYLQAHQLINYQTAMLDRMRALPGVQSAAVSNSNPLSGSSLFMTITIPGDSPGEKPTEEGPAVRAVSAGYFETLGIRLLNGRYLSEYDTAQTPPVIVINQSLAKLRWPSRDPLGRQIQLVGNTFASHSYGIVGVVADHKHMWLQENSGPEVYLLFSQLPEKVLSTIGRRALHFAVRTASEPFILTPTIRDIAAGVDKDQPIYNVKTMEELYSDSVARPRFRTAVFSVFGTLALALAAIGVYGVMAYSVTQRTHEICIRMALGARSVDVLRLVIRQGLTLALVGTCLGLGGAIALTRFLNAYLYEITATDAPTYIVVTLILFTVAILASYLPARRALKIDPMNVLRDN